MRAEQKSINESGIDTDWYFTDSKGHIAVVASAGGLLPAPVSGDMEKLAGMIAYFRSLPELSDDIIIEEDILRIIDNYSEDKRKAYLKNVRFMVAKGFYYFDKTIMNNYWDYRYYLKASPKRPLIIDSDIGNRFPLIVIEEDLHNLKQFFVNALH